MSTLYTSEEIIQECIEKNFANHCIEHIRQRDDWPLRANESVIEISSSPPSIKLLHQNPTQDKLRLNMTMNLIAMTIQQYGLKLNCRFILSLSDGCIGSNPYTMLCYSCREDSNHIQIPDAHIFRYIRGYKMEDPDISLKESKINFVGSDTGAIGPDLLNQRVKFCRDAVKSETIDATISMFHHFNPAMLADLGIDINSIQSRLLSIEEQLDYQFILNIDGNTSAWDRIPWAMKSNSLLIALESLHKERNWYYPFIEKEEIVSELTQEGVLNYYVDYFDSDQKERQKQFAARLLEEKTQVLYTKTVLEKYNTIYNS